jgi:hypothetical protein
VGERRNQQQDEAHEDEQNERRPSQKGLVLAASLTQRRLPEPDSGVGQNGR